MLGLFAPPEFADRSILWNSVEQIEKARDSQLTREIEAALPRELSGEQVILFRLKHNDAARRMARCWLLLPP